MPAPLTSPDSVFPPLRCSGGSLTPSEAACLWSCRQYLKSMLSWAEIRWLVIFITAFYAQAPRSFQKVSYDIWYTWSAIHSLATYSPSPQRELILYVKLSWHIQLFCYILEKNVFKKGEQQFLFKCAGLMYLFIHLFFMQYGITDFFCTFFSVHVLFLKLYAQFFFSLQFTQ